MNRSEQIRRLSPIISVALFAMAMFVLRRELRHHDYAEIMSHMGRLEPWRYGAALALTGVSYFILTGFDSLGAAYIGVALPHRRIALASFIGYAVSNNLGGALLSGGSVRYRLYSAWGLGGFQITQILLFCQVTFLEGFSLLAGASLLLEPTSVAASLNLPHELAAGLGVVLLLCGASYLGLGLILRGPIPMGKRLIRVPPLGLRARQAALGTIDLVMASCVLFVLLPSNSDVTLPMFVGVYTLALMSGLLSLIPGGLGVFDSILVAALSPQVPAGAVLGALVVYRAIYYLLPLMVATVLLTVFEIRHRNGRPGPPG